MKIEDRLKSMGIELPEPPPPAGNYIGAVTVMDRLVYLAGHGPHTANGYAAGKVGSDLSVDEAYQAARTVGINMLGTLKAEIKDLDRVRRFVKVLGMVNAIPDFKEHPKVINGFSDFMVEVFGDPGRCARSAVGMGSLPFQIPVEIEAIVEID